MISSLSSLGNASRGGRFSWEEADEDAISCLTDEKVSFLVVGVCVTENLCDLRVSRSEERIPCTLWTLEEITYNLRGLLYNKMRVQE